MLKLRNPIGQGRSPVEGAIHALADRHADVVLHLREPGAGVEGSSTVQYSTVQYSTVQYLE